MMEIGVDKYGDKLYVIGSPGNRVSITSHYANNDYDRKAYNPKLNAYYMKVVDEVGNALYSWSWNEEELMEFFQAVLLVRDMYTKAGES